MTNGTVRAAAGIAAVGAADAAAASERTSWWRAVLGDYPTGVTAITSTGADGEPIGMIVGTFMAVSESPALVGFLPVTSSRSFAEIRRNGTFCANVLGAEHEDLCRRLAARAEDRFDPELWETSGLGNPRLTDAVSWFDARITRVTEVGDHCFVVAEVADFGVGDGRSGLPLLYLKGGYGSFAVPSLGFDLPGLGGQLRAAEGVRGVLDRLAEETGAECALSALIDDSVVVIAAANLLPSRPRTGMVGLNFPFSAPLAPAFVAWAPPERKKLWEENSRHLLGRVDREFIARLLDAVRETGYALTIGEAFDELDEVAGALDAPRSEFAGVMRRMRASAEQALAPTPAAGAGEQRPVTSVQFPVFDAGGQVRFELVLSGATAFAPAGFAALIAAARAAAAELTELTGGVVPADYPR